MAIQFTDGKRSLPYDIVRKHLFPAIESGDHKKMHLVLIVFGRAINQDCIQTLKQRFLLDDEHSEECEDEDGEDVLYRYKYTVFPNGTKHGPCTVTIDENLYSKYTYVNGLIDGDYITYYSNGNKRLIGKYVKGNRQGEFVEYEECGSEETGEQSIYRRMYYQDGLLEGKLIKYNNDNINGVVESITLYVGGKKQGQKISYNVDGSPYKTINYDNDLKNGQCEEYENDSTYKIVYNFIKGKQYGEETHYSNSVVVCRSYWHNNVLNGPWTSFYDDGSVRMTLNYINGKENGPRHIYHQNGNIDLMDNYVDGKLYGLSHKYNTKGQLLSTIMYKNYRKDGVAVEYHEGNIKRISMYRDDVIVDYTLEYYPDGTLRLITSVGNYSILYDYTNRTRKYISYKT